MLVRFDNIMRIFSSLIFGGTGCFGEIMYDSASSSSAYSVWVDTSGCFASIHSVPLLYPPLYLLRGVAPTQF